MKNGIFVIGKDDYFVQAIAYHQACIPPLKDDEPLKKTLLESTIFSK